MKIHHSLALAIALALLSGTALAQTPAPTPATQPEASDENPAEQMPNSTSNAAQTPAAAAADGRIGLVLALRPLAVGFAMGDLAKDAKLSDLTVAQIPIWLDVGYMVTRQLMLGIYAQYALASGGHQFTGSGSDIRFGVQAQYHPIEAILLDPWVGLGFGYEILKTNAKIGSGSVTLKGFEFANLQAGLDFRLGRFLGLGPFVSFSLGQYSSMSVSGSYPGGQSGGIGEKALHEWLMVGLHASLML